MVSATASANANAAAAGPDSLTRMALIDYYLPVKQAHIGLVTASGLLFALRGAAVQTGQPWAMQRPWRLLSYAIDSGLLAAALLLWAMLRIDPLAQAWLGTKLLLLGVYIVLGSLALKRGRTPAGRRVAYVAALATYGFMATVALAHHPLGLLLGLR